MKLYDIIITENNNAKGDSIKLRVNKEQLQRVQDNQFSGGFLRFNLSLYDEVTSRQTKKNKWYIFNTMQADRQINYLFDKLNS
jgi:hypothetical protein